MYTCIMFALIVMKFIVCNMYELINIVDESNASTVHSDVMLDIHVSHNVNKL